MIATLIFIRLRINWKTLKQRHFTFSCTYDSNVYLYKINVHSQKNACLNLCKTSLVANIFHVIPFWFSDFTVRCNGDPTRSQTLSPRDPNPRGEVNDWMCEWFFTMLVTVISFVCFYCMLSYKAMSPMWLMTCYMILF